MRYFIILALALLPSIAEAGTDGINSLLQVTEQRSDNANEAAMDGAEQSSGSAESQKQKRERLRQIEARPASPGQQGLGSHAPMARTKHDTVKNSISNDRMERAKNNDRMERAKNDATLRDIGTRLNEIKDKMDSLGDLSEEQSLRLQMHQDRMRKMMATLSNILKKSSETQSGIVQNLK